MAVTVVVVVVDDDDDVEMCGVLSNW